MQGYNILKKKAETVLHRLEHYKEEVEELLYRIEQESETLISMEKADRIIQEVAKETQNTIKEKIEVLVQMAIDSVFGPGETFKILFTQKRGRTEAELLLIGPNGEEIPPSLSSGGGLLDIISFALRLACHAIKKPATRRVLVLDEPFRFLDKARKERAAEMLEQLSHKTGMQIIMVTHDDAFIDGADRVWRVKKPKKVSKVKEVRFE